MTNAGMSAGQSACRMVFMVNGPLSSWTKVENLPLFVLLLVTNSSNLLETWPRGIETAKCEDCATRDRKHSTNVYWFSSNVSGEDCGDIVIVCRPENRPRTRSTPENAAGNSLQRSDIC